jgi:hypothetical protein
VMRDMTTPGQMICHRMQRAHNVLPGEDYIGDPNVASLKLALNGRVTIEIARM